MEIGFAMCGSFCTYAQVFPIMEELTAQHHVIPIFSQISFTTDSRFGTAAEHIARTVAICGQQPLHSIADGPVTMAVKSHLRNGRPVLVAVSTNDALAGAAENIGKLMSRKHYYFVPFGQDDAQKKPTSIVADFRQIPAALEAALQGTQIQPLLLG